MSNHLFGHIHFLAYQSGDLQPFYNVNRYRMIPTSKTNIFSLWIQTLLLRTGLDGRAWYSRTRPPSNWTSNSRFGRCGAAESSIHPKFQFLLFLPSRIVLRSRQRRVCPQQFSGCALVCRSWPNFPKYLKKMSYSFQASVAGMILTQQACKCFYVFRGC